MRRWRLKPSRLTTRSCSPAMPQASKSAAWSRWAASSGSSSTSRRAKRAISSPIPGKNPPVYLQIIHLNEDELTLGLNQAVLTLKLKGN